MPGAATSLGIGTAAAGAGAAATGAIATKAAIITSGATIAAAAPAAIVPTAITASTLAPVAALASGATLAPAASFAFTPVVPSAVGASAGILGTGLTLGDVGTGLGVLGSITSAGGAAHESAALADRSEFDASQAARQADIERERAAQETERARLAAEDEKRERSRQAARMRALFGARGVRPSTGTPLLTAADFEAEAVVNQERILFGGAQSSLRLTQQAGELDLQSQQLKSRARSQRNSIPFRSGGALLSGLGRTFS